MSTPGTTVFRARRIHTHDPNRPTATHVAVREGKILAVGSPDDLKAWGSFELDERFADHVLLPGLIEGHSHLMAGSMWQFAYCGAYDVTDPQGQRIAGQRQLSEVLDSLRRYATATSGPVLGWGLDPLLLHLPRVTRADLDQVSPDRPVAVLHGSGHILYVNTAALKQAQLWRTGIQVSGIAVGDDGFPVGELKGPEAMMPVLGAVGMGRVFLNAGDAEGIRAFARLAVRAGVTTATDLGASSGEQEVASLLQVTGDDAYPLRMVSALRCIGMRPADAVAQALALRGQSTERLRLGRIKIVADGSIQGYSARLRWPGYVNGAPNGLWYVPPETVRDTFALALEHGLQVHVHTNGDEAVDMVLDAMEAALVQRPRPDHRFTLQHCQLADAAQFRRMRALGMCVNLFVNHVYYWGEAHRASTVGPDRAERMNACRTALDTGVVFSMHSDAPITPMAPLFTAWCAVNRFTHTGRVLGEHQRISVADALQAVTLGAARTLHLDHEIGSIEVGKRADFCVLQDDPYEMPPESLKDARIWGTVLCGRPFAAGSQPT